MPGRYWQSPAGNEAAASTSSYGKQARRGDSLDLGEVGDILDAHSVRGADGAAAGGAPSEAASEMSMASFDVNSFHDGMTGSVGADSGGFHTGATTAGAPPMQPRPSEMATEPTPTSFSGSSTSTRTTPASSDPTTARLVEAAYTQFDESPDEPDLKTEKIPKDKNERCQFHDCPNRARVAQSYGKFCNRHVIVSPCGFPGCREKAMERAAMCVKHMEQGKEALQAVLDARSQNVPVCRTAGCFKNDQGRGYCRGHEKLLMATGRLPPHINKRRLNSAYTMCSYPDCTKHSQRHHLCRTHGNLIIKQAQELADRPGNTETYEEILGRMQKDIRRCTHENCTKNSQRDRLCTMHYYEKHNLQKDGSTPANATPGVAVSNEKLGSSQVGADIGGGSDVRAVERTRCEKPGCGNLSYAAGLCVEHTKESLTQVHNQERYGEPFLSGRNSNLFSANVGNEVKQGLFISNGKAPTSGASVSARMTATMNTTNTKCTNPMCDRESYGRDYCEACQRLFAPLVVSINDIPTNSSGYPFNADGSSISQAENKVLLCRVGTCGQESVRGGLCASHLRAFQTGSLSVDQVKLDSQAQQREQELAEAAAAAAAAAAEVKQASPSASGKSRKYYCKVDGCDKQAQKRNLCKRHFRMQEGALAGKSQPDSQVSGPPNSFISGVQQGGFPQPATGCRFPSCSQLASDGSLLCLAHSKATFCWQPGCENLVDHQQFCEFHAFRQQCAYEGCMYSAERNSSGCATHAMARRCRHEYCDKFAVGSDSEWCRLHQISCRDHPCALCRLHAVSLDDFTPSENENSNRSRYNAAMGVSASKGMLGGSGYGGGSPFGRNPRLIFNSAAPSPVDAVAAAKMERIYSAFFTSERRREPPELTAAALELHNETQKSQQPAPLRPGDGGRRRSDAAEESLREAKRHAAARRQDLRQLAMDWASVKKDLQAACQAAARAFLLAYGAKAFTAVLLASRKWSSLEYGYADAARLLLKSDTLRFGAFFGSLVGVFRITELVTRAARGGQRDAVNLAIAGAVSGSALLLDSPARRNTISLYIFVRMLDVVCRHLVSIGVLPTWRYSSEMLFAISNGAIMYAFVVDPSLLPKV
ncbi:unnamed protein product [Phytophthora lilii]|uniref:Unnamed protein product n=1 Tax=Phytophthora lilii TaxID=2077276 RepID=A0A9W6WFB3_9STRA|nr:unnamed protein product [Phytophthora lilii]